MHLKTLTLRGFKSFAAATTLRLEPGVTCVVGPNGSGKSNVVDAIAWVLGEQGAKALRGGKMEDVIFAGTASSAGSSGRAPLGRAEVTLTIDNTDSALPIDFTEVSITRRMFRSGESEYEINGDTCRLLDIQELLSDSGIGREMHVIVGQGQLDAVLQARPEDRRGFIEEAAGVLKHRKRKEKALRKLDAMQANLTRLTDLTAELRRQLRPLGRQAEIAHRAATIQAELRDARLRLLGDDLRTQQAALEKDVADESALRDRRAEVEAVLGEAQRAEQRLEGELAAGLPRLEQAQETWHRLSQLAERLRGTARLAVERERHLAEPAEPLPAGRDPERLEADATDVSGREAVVAAELAAARAQLSAFVHERTATEAHLTDAERALVAAARAVADRRESLATLAGQVAALRSRTIAAGNETERLSAAAAEARDRARCAQLEFERLQCEVGALDEGELGLDQRHEAAVAAYEETHTGLAGLRDAEREAERDRTSWLARRDGLALGLTRKDGAGALLANADRVPGLLGSVAALLTVEPGYEIALAAALGGLADAVAVAGPADALGALRLLKADDAGRASVVIGGAAGGRAPRTPLPEGARWVSDLVHAPPELRPALERALADVVVVADLAAAAAVATAGELRAVTRDGDLIAADHAVGGSASAPSVIEIQAAVDEASERHARAEARVAELGDRIGTTSERVAAARDEVEARLVELHESDARMSAVAEQLGELGAATRSAAAEAERLDRARDEAARVRDTDTGELAAAEERLGLARVAPIDETPSTDERDAATASLARVREHELEARLAVRTAEERARALLGRADSLRRAAAYERESRARAEAAGIARARGAVIARAVSGAAVRVIGRLDRSLMAAAEERTAMAGLRQCREQELAGVRGRRRELSAEHERLVDVVHRDEVARAEQRLRIDALAGKALEEYGIEPEVLAADYGPEAPMPPSAAEMAEYELARERGEQVTAPVPGRFDRLSCDLRARKAERELRLLGKVNPLALEEFAALEERHAFLAEQLEDLKATRRDLLTVVREVDERIHDVFASAFTDTAREFETVFATLFPGGEGRLLLTDPDDLLATGVEVEARPPGKRVKRLSLLSGGERSLVAIALLVAIFRARPSPFYVLDEIEAALDETNLSRLLGLLEELRASSQLVVVTHQKRTMEIADALYGVAMRGDGITTVIGQRLRELSPA